MLVANIVNTKAFMTDLLKKDTFDVFELRDMAITTFISFEIHGALNKGFFEEAPAESYCLWKDIKPFAFEMVKGNRLPKYIKIVFSAPESILSAISPDVSAAFINITFENNIASVITGTSLKTFSLDKTIDYMWDEWVNQFFYRNALSLTAPEYEED